MPRFATGSLTRDGHVNAALEDIERLIPIVTVGQRSHSVGALLQGDFIALRLSTPFQTLWPSCGPITRARPSHLVGARAASCGQCERMWLKSRASRFRLRSSYRGLGHGEHAAGQAICRGTSQDHRMSQTLAPTSPEADKAKAGEAEIARLKEEVFLLKR